MNEHNGLVVTDRPKSTLWLVVDPRPFRASLPDKPQWMPVGDWVQLLVWLVLMTNPRDPLIVTWSSLIDPTHRALLESLRTTRIVNLDPQAEALAALEAIADVYRWLCPLVHPVLRTIYPQIQEGYKIRFDQLTMEGCYLTLVLN